MDKNPQTKDIRFNIRNKVIQVELLVKSSPDNATGPAGLRVPADNARPMMEHITYENR